MGKLVRVVAPGFVAGLEISEGRCVRAAPILSRALGFPSIVGESEDEIRLHLRACGWRATQRTVLLAADIPLEIWWNHGEFRWRWLRRAGKS